MSKKSRDAAKAFAAMSDEDRSKDYMSGSWTSSTFKEHQFLGFVPTKGDYHWGTVLDGREQCAAHVFRTPDGWDWGDNKIDNPELATAKPYVLMFYGIDNSSYYMRFATRQEAVDTYEIVKDGVSYDEDGMMFYNS